MREITTPAPRAPRRGRLVLDRRTALALGAFALPALALGGAARGAQALLSGQVYYRERMLLPADAVVEVRLFDVSRADAPARTLAERRFDAKGRNPLPFVLSYDPARIEAGRSYALQARILAQGRLLFTSTRRYPVLGAGPDKTEIRVERVAAPGPGDKPAPQPSSPAGRWLAEDIQGGGVLDRVQSRLDIAPDGKISGSSGCNRVAGRAEISGPSITFGALATTRMACPPAVMDQERRFLSALGTVRGWRVDTDRRKLDLLDAGGAPVLRFSAQ